jgi:isobutyryl-CoA mutase
MTTDQAQISDSSSIPNESSSDRPVRFVTAASLFDGHDASINIMRRILQSNGAEVIHLGHNRSVDEVVTAAVQEDVQGICISSYQGGHIEYFKYLIDKLRALGFGHIKVFGGGGGTIVPSEIAELHNYGVARIFSPQDGQRLGLVGMIQWCVEEAKTVPRALMATDSESLLSGDTRALARIITAIEDGRFTHEQREDVLRASLSHPAPVLGITGTGGSGKSSLTDELLRRFRIDQEDKLRIAVIAVDPTRRRSGGALLGDRIRMNAIDSATIYFRSLATRSTTQEIPAALNDSIAACRAAGFDLIIVETPGIGQGDAGIVSHVDVPLYVMTPEFGAASQLEKIDMLDFAEAVVINKFERRGAEDALRDVRRQMARNREDFATPVEQLPVFGTVAARFNDDGVTALYQHVRGLLAAKGLRVSEGVLPRVDVRSSTISAQIVPPSRSRYLAEISEGMRAYHRTTDAQAALARMAQQYEATREALAAAGKPTDDVAALAANAQGSLSPESVRVLTEWPQIAANYSGESHTTKVRDRELKTTLYRETLSGNRVRKVSLPRYNDNGDLLSFLRREHIPGYFPYTAGVFPFKRENENPTRMFAGEGDAFRTNKRFHLLAEGQPATRLSTAFDSVTLYGFNPDERPDIYGKVGNSGVSIATLDDMKVLYSGFDLVDPATSVSMTINGPAPTLLAMFLNTAIDQRVDAFVAANNRQPSAEEADAMRADALRNVRGTVQADILKEDQGQNTCIFSTEFSLRMMADIAEWFVEHEVRNFYSVSISGYHIAEAGANPISQLAFTLANGFTYVEAYLARGMKIDDFAPNLSFFFSNGMDPEYNVIGRVARRIWAVAMRDRYGANDRSQKLKYHVQTSGRSLHAQEMSFNDIRTTLQALTAIYDNCNSLHTNAYDEAVTTPTTESVRRAMAIQMIVNAEWGMAFNENPLQGSFVIDELTDLVEEAVLLEFDRIAERGGVLGAMETGYQRGRIQDESMLYEHRKHDGSLPIIGVNTFRNPAGDEIPESLELARADNDEKQSQLRRLEEFQRTHSNDRPRDLTRLRDAALKGENVFAVLMDAVRTCSLGEITNTLFDVGGRYRRNV